MLRPALIMAFPVLVSCTKKTDTDRLRAEEPAFKPDIVVAADGTGDFRTVQEAVNAAPGGRSTYFYIYIKKGTYKEVVTIPANREHLYLIGEDAGTTVLTYDNYAKRLRPDGTEYGTGGSSSFFIN